MSNIDLLQRIRCVKKLTPLLVTQDHPARDPLPPHRLPVKDVVRLVSAGRIADVKAGWAAPAELGQAFVWLAAQPPGRFSGLRFDAGPSPEKGSTSGFLPRR